jgi:hypothetical protein
VSRALALAALLALSSAAACKTPAAPPGPGSTTAAAVASELVEAGCILPSATLAGSVMTEAQGDAAPSWVLCMLEGGSVAACGTPCGDAGP